MSEGVYKKSPANEEITIVWDFRQSCLNYPTIPTCHPVCIQLRLTGLWRRSFAVLAQVTLEAVGFTFTKE
jgi:hypothetical protein